MHIPCRRPGHSLQRQVRVELERLRIRPGVDRRSVDREVLWGWLGRPSIAALLALALVDLWLVVAGLAPSDPVPASGLTGALWQVEAAVLGFAVAVALFALQVNRETLHGRSISVAPRLEASIFLGIGLLIVTGAVSLLPLSEARQSWASVPLVVSGACWLFVVGARFGEARRLTDSRELVRLRSGRLRRASNQAASRLLEARIASQLLDRKLGSLGATQSPWLEPANKKASTDVAFGRAGLVRDLRMCSLRDVLAKLPAQPSAPIITLPLWRRVSPKTRLAQVPGGIRPDGVSRLQGAVQLDPRWCPLPGAGRRAVPIASVFDHVDARPRHHSTGGTRARPCD